MTSLVAPGEHRRDAGVFLARVVRLDPAGLVRVRPSGPEHLTLWAQLPFDVLVARTVAGNCQDDVTVAAAELLSVVTPHGAGGTVELPRRRDAEWRGSLPPERGWQHLDDVPADVVQHLLAAGEKAFRAADAAQAAGESLLDHETLKVRGDQAGSPEAAVPFRLLLALARMAFLSPQQPVAVSVLGPWLRLTAAYGNAYRRTGTGLLAL
jgi:hypothetical protein